MILDPRWQPVTPIGVPHASSEDDHSQGYFIPKGTIIVANQWYVSLVRIDTYLSFMAGLYPEFDV